MKLLPKLNSLLLILSFNVASLNASDCLKFEGFLHKSQILVHPESFTGAKDHVFEEPYVLYLLEPIRVLLPIGIEEDLSFFVVKMSDQLDAHMTKYVTLEGEWEGMALPLFAHVPILRVDRITRAQSDCVEEMIPKLARAACNVAYWEALASGFKMIEVDGDHLVETSPDGSKRVIQSLPPRKHVKKGTKIVLE